MKTSTTEIRCDACNQVIPLMRHKAIFATFRGPQIGLKKIDLCDMNCLTTWSQDHESLTGGFECR